MARDFLRAAGFVDRTGAGFEPGAVIDGLAGLHRAVNAIDPHYRYDFGVCQRPVSDSEIDQARRQFRLELRVPQQRLQL
ncbi:MAG: hypothetical protein J0H43_09430, partial [Actinobacteria bacterium]|nr:hypothetical protein [Actinomycetota bacterium]